MIKRFPEIPPVHLENICRILGEETTGARIGQHLDSCGLTDTTNESTKWRRLSGIFSELQKTHRCSNHLCRFIKAMLPPTNYIGRRELFEEIRSDLNQNLVFCGIEYREDGEFHKITPAKTLSEAERRFETLIKKLKGRTMHPEILKYCKTELLQDNYFHAVFEANKGLAQRIRILSGCEGDGAKLVDAAFSVRSPHLAFNTLQTETEQSEHKGLAQLLKGCFTAIRNPLAHEPKLLWQGSEDAVDYLTLLSLMRRKLDLAVVIPRI